MVNLGLIAAISVCRKTILSRAVVSATFQGSLALIVIVTVAFPLLTEDPTLAAEAATVAGISRVFSAGLQIPVTQEICLTICILVALSPLSSSCNDQ